MIDTDKLISILIDDDIDEFSFLLANSNDHTFQINKNRHKYTDILEHSQGAPLLSIAAYFGSQKCYKYLADTETEIPDFKCSPFEYACAGGNMNIIRDIFDKFTKFPLIKNSCLLFRAGYLSIYHGNTDVVKFLFFNGYKFGIDEILIAFQMGYDDITNFFFENKIIHEKDDVLYKLMIMYTCKSGNVQILNNLLTKYDHKKLDIDIYQKFINHSCKEGNISCVKYLISNSNNIFPRSNLSLIQPSLLYASHFNFIDIIIYLINQGGTFDNITDTDNSPLINALLSSSCDTAKFYLNHLPKIDNQTINEYISTVFRVNYSFPIIQLLLDYMNTTLFDMKLDLFQLAVKNSAYEFLNDLQKNQISLDFIQNEHIDKEPNRNIIYSELNKLNVNFK